MSFVGKVAEKVVGGAKKIAPIAAPIIGGAFGGPAGALAGASLGGTFKEGGPLSGLTGGGSGDGTQTITSISEPSKLASPFIRQIFEQAQRQFQGGPLSFFPGQTVAGVDPATQRAQELQMLSAETGIPQFLQSGNMALQRALAPIDPARDPSVMAFADAAVDPLFKRFEEQTLPGLRSEAVMQGAFGGSRQQIVEQQALGDLARTAGNVRADIFGNALQSQLQQQAQALGLFPQFTGLQTLPAELLSQVGAQRQGQAQAEIAGERERFEFGQLAPLSSLQNFSNIINQFGGGVTTTTGPGPSGPSPLSAALGGGLLGGTLGGFLPETFQLGGFGGGQLGAMLGGGAGLIGLLG